MDNDDCDDDDYEDEDDENYDDDGEDDDDQVGMSALTLTSVWWETEVASRIATILRGVTNVHAGAFSQL